MYLDLKGGGNITQEVFNRIEKKYIISNRQYQLVKKYNQILFLMMMILMQLEEVIHHRTYKL